MIRNLITFLLFFGISFSTISQKTLPLPPGSREQLEEISIRHSIEYSIKKNEALEYAIRSQLPARRILEDGRVLELQYLDRKGFPVFHTTHNAVAAFSVTTDRLYPEGSLGMNLTGKFYPVGIWDAGMADSTHQEFEGRIKNEVRYQGADDHATHVTGTIGATGINANARGMAFESELKSFDWNNYLSEIADEAAKGLLISNQSFGIQLGWTRDDGQWVWNGDPEANEDYRFGFYTDSHSRVLDEIAYLAPNLLMVWSAGNARSGVGNGTKNPNGPYDCIGPEAISKNTLAVGAVEKIPGGYTGPSDVRMSTFSSWGPADDGRIKPDIVAPGVNLLSSFPGNIYRGSSGTSMSAPVVSGSLILLQELFHNTSDRHMRSATLKALAIHTVYDAGKSRGPDYSFGWGLLNTSAAADLIKNNDSLSYFIKELTLNDNEVYEFEIYSDGFSEIVATLAWTDPPGVPPPADSINPPDLMLVNDLDMKIIDEAGNIFYPWILDPAQPSGLADKGDNFRDNVEKILVNNPEPRKYTVSVSHKNELEGGSQDFSLILSTTAVAPHNSETLYWIGNDGKWSEPLNWAHSSGGEPAGLSPDKETNVIIDENSFSGSGQFLVLDSIAECRSFSWFAKDGNGIDFDKFDISVHADFYLSGGIHNGSITGNFVFRGQAGNINTGNNTGDRIRFVFENEEGEWKLLSDLEAESIVLKAGRLDLSFHKLTLNSFISDSEKFKYVDLAGSDLYITGLFDLTGENLVFDSRELKITAGMTGQESTTVIKSDTLNIAGVEVLNGMLVLEGNMRIDSMVNRSRLEIYGSNKISDLVLEAGSSIWLAGGSEQELSDLSVNSSSESPVLIHSLSDQPAALVNHNYIKFCLDFLDIYNVTAGGEAVWSAGENSVVTGEASGWKEGVCEDILFARFELEYPCINSYSQFIDRSDGNITNWLWDFGDEANPGFASELQNPFYTYENTGSYKVSMSISDSSDNATLEKEITISENTIPENDIFINAVLQKYVSTQTAPVYQWYNDGTVIPGATARTLDMGRYTGEIRVLLSDQMCNRFSNSLVVSVYEASLPEEGLTIFPNPASDIVNIKFADSYNGKVLIEIIDLTGTVIYSSYHMKTDETMYTRINAGNLFPGYYFLRTTAGNLTRVRSMIIN